MSDQLSIRAATAEDCGRILSIYGYYVKNTIVSFEYEVPGLDEMESRMQNIQAKYPYLVAELNGIIVGYAYAADFRYRSAYQWSPESTIYLSHEIHGKGIGHILYSRLFELLRLQGFYNVFGGVGLPNEASVKLHLKCGFTVVGTYRNIGYKHKGWHSTQWFQLILDEHPIEPAPPKKPGELPQEQLNSILHLKI
jgi:L-amino acid N-acyltransferase YncA